MTDVRHTARQQRLRAALRENLKKRKGQIKGRAVTAAASVGQHPFTDENQSDNGNDNENNRT